MKPLYMAAG